MGCGKSTAFLALMACVAVLVDTVSLDLGTTKELEEAIKKDNFVLSLKHIKPRKRARGAMETLFAVDFPGAEHKLALVLDRRTKKVTVDTLEDGRKRSQHFTVDTLQDDTILKSLILAVNQTQPGAHANLYIDCISYGMVATPKSLRDMFSSMRNPRVEVFHEKRYPMEVDGHRDLRMVLSRNECPLPLETQFHKKFDNIFDEDYLNNDLKDDPNVQAAQPDYDVYRGDIPLVHTIDDISVINALNNLIKAVNLEVQKCEETTSALNDLRRIIAECDLCRQRPPPTPQVATCETHPPGCFPGVRCHNTAQGPRCGSCPRGYIGDGYQCTPGHTCAENNPCFNGVQCRDGPRGAECGPCPRGYEGDGRTCSPIRNPCDYNRCAPGCVPVWPPHNN